MLTQTRIVIGRFKQCKPTISNAGHYLVSLCFSLLLLVQFVVNLRKPADGGDHHTRVRNLWFAKFKLTNRNSRLSITLLIRVSCFLNSNYADRRFRTLHHTQKYITKENVNHHTHYSNWLTKLDLFTFTFISNNLQKRIVFEFVQQAGNTLFICVKLLINLTNICTF